MERFALADGSARVGHVEVAHLSHLLPDGRLLLDDVSFRAGDGSVVALVGPNGAGKTTLMRIIAGDEPAQSGTVTSSGGLAVMRQFAGGVRDDSTVRDLLLSIAAQRLRDAASRLDAAELAMMEHDDEPTQLRYAAALGVPFDRCQYREVKTLSGGEQRSLGCASSRKQDRRRKRPASRTCACGCAAGVPASGR
jgi:ATPase subunit of ABC transporter with duplicated ATPase domains